jgi:hypothetical protein
MRNKIVTHWQGSAAKRFQPSSSSPATFPLPKILESTLTNPSLGRPRSMALSARGGSEKSLSEGSAQSLTGVVSRRSTKAP